MPSAGPVVDLLSETLIPIAAAGVWAWATGHSDIAWALGALSVALMLWRSRGRMVCAVYHPDRSLVAARIASRMPSLTGKYAPPALLSLPPSPVAAILQTMAGERKFNECITYHRELVHVAALGPGPNRACCGPDEVPAGIVSLDWVDIGTKSTSDLPIVLLVPGVTGCSNSTYIRRYAAGLVGCGVRPVAYNPRGLGGNPIQTSFLYSAGWTEDLRRVIDHIFDKHPRSLVYAAGFSLGANVLAKYLGEEGATCRLRGAACFAPPIDPLSMMTYFGMTKLGNFIDSMLARFVQKRVATRNYSVLDQHPEIDPVEMLRARTMAQFDGAATAPMMGYDCASDYYRAAASGPWIQHIAVPALFVHANNDPVFPASLVRRDNFVANPNLVHVVTDQGAHSLDWPTSLRGRTGWGVNVLIEFIRAATPRNPGTSRYRYRYLPAQTRPRPESFCSSNAGSRRGSSLSPSLSPCPSRDNLDGMWAALASPGPTSPLDSPTEKSLPFPVPTSRPPGAFAHPVPHRPGGTVTRRQGGSVQGSGGRVSSPDSEVADLRIDAGLAHQFPSTLASQPGKGELPWPRPLAAGRRLTSPSDVSVLSQGDEDPRYIWSPSSGAAIRSIALSSDIDMSPGQAILGDLERADTAWMKGAAAAARSECCSDYDYDTETEEAHAQSEHSILAFIAALTFSSAFN